MGLSIPASLLKEVEERRVEEFHRNGKLATRSEFLSRLIKAALAESADQKGAGNLTAVPALLAT